MEQLNRFTDRLEDRNWVNLSALLDWTDVEVVCLLCLLIRCFTLTLKLIKSMFNLWPIWKFAVYPHWEASKNPKLEM